MLDYIKEVLRFFEPSDELEKLMNEPSIFWTTMARLPVESCRVKFYRIEHDRRWAEWKLATWIETGEWP